MINSKKELLELANQLLKKGTQTAKHPFHQFTIGSFNKNSIEQRMVVLRRWVLKRRTLIFHTDIRAPKVTQLKENNHCSLLFYSNPDKLQLRFSCIAHIHHKDRLSEYLYSQTTDSQRKCYAFSKPPSMIIPEKTKELWEESSTEIVKVDPYENFAACVCNFDKLDLLYLTHEGHVRILYQWDKYGNLSAEYMIA